MPAAFLANLVAPGLSPAFSPGVTQYTFPKPAGGSVPVTATLADPTLKLYVASTPVASGQTWNAWIGSGGTVSVVLYQGWTEVGRYTLTSQ